MQAVSWSAALQGLGADLPAMTAFVVWESMILLAAVALTRWLSPAQEASSRPTAERVLAWLLIDLALQSVFGSAFGLLRFNSSSGYLFAAGATLALLHLRAPRRLLDDARTVHATLRLPRLPLNLGNIVLLAVALGFAAIVLSRGIMPTDEWDTLGDMNAMLRWIANEQTPYTVPNHYCASWHTTFLPGMVLLQSSLFNWWIALKVVIACGLGIWLLAQSLGLSHRLSLLLTANGLAITHLWTRPSGISSLKVDLPSAAGQVVALAMLALALRKGWSRLRAVLLILAAGLTWSRYNGPVLTIMLAGLAGLMFYEQLWQNRKRVLAWCGIAAVLLFVYAGHYYLKNLILFGNPMYPVRIQLLGISLPGELDLHKTTVLYHIANPDIWRLFFFPSSLKIKGVQLWLYSPLGMLFPITLAASLLIGAWTSLRGVLRLGRQRKLPGFILGLWVLAGWLLFVRTYYSAAKDDGALYIFRDNINSLRYAVGLLIVSEVFLVHLLNRWLLRFRGRWAALAPSVLLVISWASRVEILLFRQHRPAASFAELQPVFPILLLLLGGLVFWCQRIRAQQRRTWLIWIGALLVGLLAAPLIYDANRQCNWLRKWGELPQLLYDAAPTEIVYLTGDGDRFTTFPFAGRHLQHRFRTMSVQEFCQRPPTAASLDLVLWASKPPILQQLTPELQARVLSQGIPHVSLPAQLGHALESLGLREVYGNPQCAAWAKDTTVFAGP